MSWLHRLINPEPCQMCEYLKIQIEVERQFNRVLFEKLTERNIPVPAIIDEPKVPVVPKYIPWQVRRQQLEAEDKRAAQVLKQKQDEISKLEQELGVDKEAGDARENS